ncbi:hypothetical protein SAMN02745157_2526 [Kaistia soli DSM 19436]|uniref:Uncharacterized protein n=1 Tax=Kaistia soli DSM 19436 TaxID=1122133 RepID=A0A1M5D0U5_9HYPH|nr:hypothetical protein [Kaistia soli]SHF60629.1 hypothetical protein SAMN02745157_2526 [Kaistia soli DSM 19436]
MTATALATKSPPAAAPAKAVLPPVLSLDDRIRAALTDHAASTVIAELAAEVDDAVAAAEKHYAAANERAIDPTIPGEAVAEARRVMEDNDFIRQRMHEAARRLKDELDVAKAREADAARQIEVSAFFAERDLLIRDLRQQYENAAGVILSLLRRLQRSDAELARLGLGLDAGAETGARGVPAHFHTANGPVSRLYDARLPQFYGHGYLWPR